MARINKLSLYDPDASSFPADDRNTLGDLLVFLLYNNIDQAAKIVQRLGPEDQQALKIVGEKLGQLCEVCKHDV